MELPSHEVLAQLARDDPQAYETLRRQVIDSFIDSAPARVKRRLRGIQFRVDGERRLSQSALGATLRIYDLMWRHFRRLNHHWQDVMPTNRDVADGPGSARVRPYLTCLDARILEFRRAERRGKVSTAAGSG